MHALPVTSRTRRAIAENDRRRCKSSNYAPSVNSHHFCGHHAAQHALAGTSSSELGDFLGVVSFSSGVQGGAPVAQRLFCTLRSPGSLFCCVVTNKQLQKSLNLTAE